MSEHFGALCKGLNIMGKWLYELRSYISIEMMSDDIPLVNLVGSG